MRGDPAPWEYWRWQLVKELSWSLAEVDALSLADFHEWFQVRDGVLKAAGVGVKVHRE